MANEKLIALSEVKKKIAAIRQYFSGPHRTEQDKLAQAVAKMCLEEVKKIKLVDAVEVVRCKDCKHWKYDARKLCGRCDALMCYRPDYFWCMYGERRTDNG